MFSRLRNTSCAARGASDPGRARGWRAALALAALAVFLGGGARTGAAAEKLRVVVSPAGARIAPSATVQFQADVTDANDATVATARLTWSVRPEGAGTITATGLFTAGARPGEALIRAEATDGSRRGTGFAFARIGAEAARRAPLRVDVDPARARILPGEGVTFRASVRGAAGDSTVMPEWRVVPDAFGRIDASGHFTAGPGAGEGRVVALVRANGTAGFGQARVVVRPAGAPGDRARGAIAAGRLVVVPTHLDLRPGESRTLRAQLPVTGQGTAPSSVTWSVDPVDLGSIATDGTFTAGDAPGSGVILASVTLPDGRALNGAAAVQVRVASEGGIRIVPRNPVLSVGQVQQFTLDVNPVQQMRHPDATAEWRVVPEGLGAITPTGLFTAGRTPGAGQVVVQVRGSDGHTLATSSATVTIVGEGAASGGTGGTVGFLVTPPVITVPRGDEIDLSVTATGVPPVGVVVQWVVSPSRLGVVRSEEGGRHATFHGLMAGTGTVTATLYAGQHRVAQSTLPLTVTSR